MSEKEKPSVTARDINTTYLIVLTSIIETLVESGAVEAEKLAEKIEGYAENIGSAEDNKAVRSLSTNFANIARNAKGGGE